jgi:hypothetical protein
MKQPLEVLTVVLITGFIAVGCSKNNDASFSRDVMPIIKDHCIECHSVGGKGYKETGLDMASYSALMRGTKFGPIIVQGDSTSSTLMRLIEHKADPSIAMPHHESKLPKEHIDIVRDWIDQGARDN